MHLHTLGKLELSGGELSRPKPLLLLAYLTIEGSKSRPDLAELFYLDTSNPAANLRLNLKRINTDAPSAVQTQGKRLSASVPSDVTELLNALEKQDFERAVSLYNGAFLDGFSLKDWPIDLEEWVYATREYLASQVRQAMLQLATKHATNGDFNKAANLARKAYKLAGAPDPNPEQFKQIYTLMLTADSFETNDLKKAADDYFIELNQTKENARAQFENAKTPENTPTNLQKRGNSFVGRNQELEQITTLLNTPDTRLLSLYGQGGIGKTRLVLHAGLEQLKQEQFKDGNYLVELDALSSFEQIPSEITQTLNIELNETDLTQQIISFIADKQFLLILDNFDHLVEGAQLCSQLLRNCPHLKMLISSRERLNIAEEYALEITGLSVPQRGNLTLEEALDYDIIKLFIDRAKRAKLTYTFSEQDIEAVTSIAQLVEGLPLGIELAAAGISLMNPQAIADAITQDLDSLYTPARDVNTRHQSLRTTFDYSWNLLSEKEQTVLKNLSVCIGGFTREAASNIAGANIPILRSLLDKALLRVDNTGRYTRHMLLYQYTQERFEQDKENKHKLEEQHASYYRDYAEQAEPQLISKGQLEWLKKLESDKDNLRKALRWNLNHDVESALRQAAALRRFWETRGYLTEGRSWLSDVLAKTKDTQSLNYLKANYALGVLTHRQKGLSEAQKYFDESEISARQLGNKTILADAINYQAGAAWSKGNLDHAQKLLNDSIEIKRELGDKRGVAVSLSNLGLLAKNQNNLDLAKALYTESLEISKQLIDKSRIALSLKNLGDISHLEGALDKARSLYQKSLAIYIEQNDIRNESKTTISLGYIYLSEGQYSNAHQLFSKSLKLSQNCSSVIGQIESFVGQGIIFYVQDDYVKAQERFIKVLKEAAKIGEKELVASTLQGLGCIEAKFGYYEKAVVLWGNCEGILPNSENVTSIKQLLPKNYSNCHSLANLELGKSNFTKIFNKGKEINFEQVVVSILDGYFLSENISMKVS